MSHNDGTISILVSGSPSGDGTLPYQHALTGRGMKVFLMKIYWGEYFLHPLFHADNQHEIADTPPFSVNKR